MTLNKHHEGPGTLWGEARQGGRSVPDLTRLADRSEKVPGPWEHCTVSRWSLSNSSRLGCGANGDLRHRSPHHGKCHSPLFQLPAVSCSLEADGPPDCHQKVTSSLTLRPSASRTPPTRLLIPWALCPPTAREKA